jgi:hypothetical protein
MLLRIVTLTLLLLTMLAAGPAVAQGRHSGRYHSRHHPRYHSRTYHDFRPRSQFYYRNPYQWEAEKNYFRNRSRGRGFYGGYYESYFFGYGGVRRHIRP